MNSVKCPECGLTNWSAAIACKRCGVFLQAESEPPVSPAQDRSSPEEHSFADADPQPTVLPNAPPHPPLPAQAHNYGEMPYRQSSDRRHQNYQPENLKTGIAVASMVLGILGCFTSIVLIGIIFAPVGLILGIVALTKAKKMPVVYGGRGFALAGVATSGVIILFVPIIAAIAIPSFLAARRAANESSAISTLKILSAAEASYMASSYGKCGDVQTLIATKLIDVSLAGNEKSGYRFMVVNLPQGGCELLATPITASTGNLSFYYSTADGILRAGSKKGVPADKNDFPVNAGTLGKNYPAPKTASQKSNIF